MMMVKPFFSIKTCFNILLNVLILTSYKIQSFVIKTKDSSSARMRNHDVVHAPKKSPLVILQAQSQQSSNDNYKYCKILREYDLWNDFAITPSENKKATETTEDHYFWPFDDKIDFQRIDEDDDSEFYTKPRMIHHIDEWAVMSLRNYYESELSSLSIKTKTIKILDLCSSWTSHFDLKNKNSREVIGIGMNEEELKVNEELKNYYVQDLNKNPSFSLLFKSSSASSTETDSKETVVENSFDVITMALSVDYLTRPKEVFQEINRLLKPGGVVLIPVSNRYFRKKAIKKWLDTKEPEGRLDIVASYLYYSTLTGDDKQKLCSWESIQTFDIKQDLSSKNIKQFVLNQDLFRWFATAIFRGTWDTDPLYVVKAVKKTTT